MVVRDQRRLLARPVELQLRRVEAGAVLRDISLYGGNAKRYVREVSALIRNVSGRWDGDNGGNWMSNIERDGATHGRFRLNAPKVIADVIDGEVVIMNLERGSYYSLDQVGADIWGSILTGRSTEEIADAIAEHFAVARERALAVTGRITQQMLEEDLIVAVSGDDNGRASPPAIAMASTTYVEPTLTVYSDMKDLLAFDPPLPGIESYPST